MQNSMVEQLTGKVVLVQAGGVQVKGKIVAYSHYWPFEPELLVVQDDCGDWFIVRGWSLIGEVKQ